MKIVDFKTIRDLQIAPITFYNWIDEAWKYKPEVVMPPKLRMMQGKSGRHVCMACVMPEMDIAGAKLISRNMDSFDEPPARNSHIIIQRCSKQGLLAVMDGIYITNMRTGAVAVHNVKTFARPGFKTLGMMGLGIAARAFFLIFQDVYCEEQITVKLLRYKEQAEEFAARFQGRANIQFEIVDSMEEVCACDVVVSCLANATTTLCDDAVFAEGCTIIPVHTRGFQNCDLFFDKVFVDDIGHVRDFRYFNQFKSCAEVSDVICGRAPGRENAQEKVIVYCGGLALHDVYCAYKIFERVGDECPAIEMALPETRFWI